MSVESVAVRENAARRAPVSTIVFWALMGVGLLLRVLFVLSSGHHLDADHAVVYLMARHVAEGEFPVFFWGQSYGGTLLQWSAGLVMAVVGSSVEVLAIVSSLWILGAALLLRVIVRRSFGRLAGDIAATAFWFPGFIILEVSTRDPGFYGPSIVLALGVITLATGSLKTRRWWIWIAAGALSGLALWTSPMSVVLAAPGVLALVVRDRAPLRWLAGVGTAAITALPWILEAVRNAGATKPLGGGAYQVSWDSFVSLFAVLIPSAFPGDVHNSVRIAIGVAAVAALVLLLALGLVRRALGATLLALGTIALAVVIVVGAGVELKEDSVRYAIFLMPAFAAAAAWPLSRLRPLGWVALAAIPALTASMVYVRSNHFDLNTSARFDTNYVAVEQLLEERGIEHAYGNYWLSYPLTAATNERITVAPLVVRRYTPYETEAEQAGPPVIIVHSGQYNDVELNTSTVLPAHERIEVGNLAVYFYEAPFDVYAQPWGLF